jgi:hypothetical protein
MRTADAVSAQIQNRDAALDLFLFFLRGTPCRLMDLERQLETRLLGVAPQPLLVFTLPDLLDDERR